MIWLHWNEINGQEDLSSFVYGPVFSMLKEEHSVISSKGFLTQFEILEGNYPQNFIVLFIIINNLTSLIEIYDYRFASLLVSKKINGRLVDEGIIKVSDSSLYFTCEDSVIYNLNSKELHHQDQGIRRLDEETSYHIKEYLTKIRKKKISRIKIDKNYLISAYKGNITTQDLKTGKKIVSRRLTKGTISAFDCGGGCVFCGCRGGKSKIPDQYSEIIVLELNTLNILYRLNTEFSYHASIACTHDGSRIVCHDKDLSFCVLRFEKSLTNTGFFNCVENFRTDVHPGLFKFSRDNNWLFFGNHDGIYTLVSKNIKEV